MNQSVSTLTGKIKTKIVFVGDQAVGKSSVIEKYVHNRFDQSAHPTVGIDFIAKNVIHKNRNYRLQLWDTAGQQRFKSLIPSYLRDSQCALILFDVTNKKSLQNADQWFHMYNQNKTQGGFTFLIGNKIDLEAERQVSVQQCQKHATQLGIPYFQISAKTGLNVDTLFFNLLDVCYNNSIDAAKFNVLKHSEPKKIDQVEQKNQDDKQNKTQNLQSKLKQQKNQQQTINDSINIDMSKNRIRLQNRKQSKIKQKKCC